MINNGKKLYKEYPYLDQLKTIVSHLNDLLGNVMDKYTIPGFNGFIGKYYHNALKREIYELIYSNEGVYVFRIDYYTNIVHDLNEINKNDKLEEG